MNTRPYSELVDGIAALAGADLADQELARIKFWVNRRARKAYAASQYWPRFLKVGEERIVSDEGLLPYTQTGLDDIKTIRRIHATDPFKSNGAFEYANYVASSDGVLITGYQATEASSGADMLITGSLNPDIAGRYRGISVSTGRNGGTASLYQSLSNLNYFIAPTLIDSGGVDLVNWILGDSTSEDYWQLELPTPLEVAPTPEGLVYFETGAATGVPTVTEDVIYSAYVTYRAALPSTYGDGDGEEDEIPEEWFCYIENGTYADWLRNEGQNEKAVVEDAASEAILLQELEALDSQGGSHVHTRVINHNNTQWR